MSGFNDYVCIKVAELTGIAFVPFRMDSYTMLIILVLMSISILFSDTYTEVIQSSFKPSPF